MRHVLEPADSLFDARSWPELVMTLFDNDVDLAILDPAAMGCENSEAITAVLDTFSTLSVLICTAPGNGTLTAISKLNARGMHQTMLLTTHGCPVNFREAMVNAHCHGVVVRFLAKISEPLALLPGVLTHGVTVVFEKPEKFNAGSDLAIHAGVSNSCMYRSFKAAGLSGPKKTLMAAKVLRAYSCLKQSNTTVSAVAKMLRYAQPRLLRGASVLALGTRPSELSRMTEHKVMEGLQKWLLLLPDTKHVLPATK